MATATYDGVPVDHNGHAQSFKAQLNKNGHNKGNFPWTKNHLGSKDAIFMVEVVLCNIEGFESFLELQ